jgi:hypothetical protein
MWGQGKGRDNGFEGPQNTQAGRSAIGGYDRLAALRSGNAEPGRQK